MRLAPVLLVLALLALLLAGCTTLPSEPVGDATPVDAAAAARTTWYVTCRLLDEARDPLLGGTCVYAFGAFNATRVTDDTGTVVLEVPIGLHGKVEGSAPGRATKWANFTVDGNKVVEMVLERVENVSAGNATAAAPDVRRSPGDGLPRPPPGTRLWDVPVAVVGGQNEPHVVVDAAGVIYHAPTTNLYRSLDGGATWEDVTPTLTESPPSLGSDTSVSVAPDGSLWWTRYWGYAATTVGCTSLDKGNTWTCDNTAIPGVTDRMWIVGLNSEEGYLQTNEGLYHHVWAHTTTGSLKYAPHATTDTVLAVRNGNMVYDEVNGAVWQIEHLGGRLQLIRVDGDPPLVETLSTPVAAPAAVPSLSVWNGVLWTVGEPAAADGSHRLVAARSVDGGRTWAQFPVPTAAASVTHSAISAGPMGRVALVYYGSDKPGDPTANGGTWSLYVAETDSGHTDNPTWIETQVVEKIHVGNVCTGLSCEDRGDDPEARFSGDLIGIWIDLDGNAHVAYNSDVAGPVLSLHVRQQLGR